MQRFISYLDQLSLLNPNLNWVGHEMLARARYAIITVKVYWPVLSVQVYIKFKPIFRRWWRGDDWSILIAIVEYRPISPSLHLPPGLLFFSQLPSPYPFQGKLGEITSCRSIPRNIMREWSTNALVNLKLDFISTQSKLVKNWKQKENVQT